MTTNALRCQIISRVLRMNHSALVNLQSSMDSFRRAAIPADLPEWIPATEAAELLQLTPRHMRRLCADQLQITYQMRQHNGHHSWYLHRDLLRSLATPIAERAKLRQPSAKQHAKMSGNLPDVRTSTARSNSRQNAIPSNNDRPSNEVCSESTSANYPGHEAPKQGVSANCAPADANIIRAQ